MKFEKIKKNYKYTFLVVVFVILTGVIIYKIYDSYAFYKNVDSYDILKNKIGTFNSPKLISALSNDTSITLEYGYDKEVSDVEEYIYYGTEENNLKNKISGNKIENLEKGTIYYFKKCFKSESNIEVCSDVYNLLTAGIVSNFDYTGSEQTYTPVCNGTYQLETWGAQGGDSNDEYIGGRGAYTSGILSLEENKKIFVYVGSQGTKGSAVPGGWNGGGVSGNQSGYNTYGGSGGGATDVRLVEGNWNDFNSLKSRIIVSGAGGGGAIYNPNDYGYGGAAGGLEGYFGTSSKADFRIGSGGTQINHGYYGTAFSFSDCLTNSGCDKNAFAGFGYGGKYTIYRGNTITGGGGSGYYGGNLGGDYGAAGGGGSSFISGHDGCNAISEESTIENIIHTGQSTHYSGYKFTDTIMIDGLGYNWTNEKGEYVGQPQPDGTVKTGHEGNGYARITLLACEK